jgi:hypothetical protein
MMKGVSTMAGKYSELSMEELRGLLLGGSLQGELEQEEYSLLMEAEFERPVPDNEVIRLCTRALEAFSEYAELDDINIDIHKLISNTVQPKPRQLRIRRGLLASAAVIAALAVTQLVALALGFDLYGYIFRWERELLIAEHEESKAEFELVFEVFHGLHDVPDEMKALVPEAITDNYDFSFASMLITGSDSFSYKFVFIKDDVVLNFYVDKGLTVYIQREDDLLEEFSVNGRDYTIYSTSEQLKVIWTINGLLFDMGANLSIDELKLIIKEL